MTIGRIVRASMAIGLLVLTAACAQPSRPEAMAAGRPTDAPPQVSGARFSVGQVAGGEETNPMWTSEVSAAAFQAALTASLANAGLHDAGSNLQIDAVLEDLDQPLAGFDMTVTSQVTYRVVNGSSDILLEQRVVAPHTATVGDAFLGMERLRLANEGSIRANITRFIEILRTTPFETIGGVSSQIS